MPIRRSHEIGHALTIDLVAPGGQPAVRTTCFQAWREELPSGAVRTSTALPPRSWSAPEVPPPAGGEADRACRLLVEFAAGLGASAALRYSRLVSRRHVTDAEEMWQSREVNVFALTGRIGLANGRFISLGWSGFGDGFDRMIEGPMRRRVAWIARSAAAAAPMEAGAGPAVLDPQSTALVVHEAVGHFSEAAVDASVDLRHRLGCRLAADGFDVFDDPSLPGAARYQVDDEGTEAIGPTRVLADGVIIQQLHSRRSAAAAASLPTANARAAQITLPPIPRLSNLVMPAGTSSQDSLLEMMGSGLMVHHLSHGFSRGIEMEARIVLAERVEGGRLTGRFVSGGRVTERVDVLTRARSRGDCSELNPNALCGKHGQILYDVGTIAPALLLSSLRISA